MKVVQNTPTKLILRSIPWLSSLFCLLLILVGTGLALVILSTSEGKSDSIVFGLIVLALGPGLLGYHFWGIARRDDLIIDSAQNIFELRHSTMSGRQTIKHELEHVNKAFLQTQETSKHGTASRVALLLDGGMDAGVHPLTGVYKVGGNAAQTAMTINNWLAENNESRLSSASASFG